MAGLVSLRISRFPSRSQGFRRQLIQFSVLPSIKPEADSSVLLEHAIYLYHEEGLPEDARARMARDLLLASILKLNIYSAQAQPQQPAYASSYLRQSEEPKQLECAKSYVKACFDLRCHDLFGKVIDILVDSTNVARDVFDRRVKQIFLPLIEYAGPIANGSAVPEMHRLCRVAAKHWISSAITNPRAMTVSDISSIMQAMISGGQPGIISTE